MLCLDRSQNRRSYPSGHRPEDHTQIYASKYMAYMSSEEELKQELSPEGFHQELEEEIKV